MNGGHQPALDSKSLVEDLGERGETIGGAGGVGDNDVVGVELVVVDTEHHSVVDLVVGGNGKYHPLGPGVDVLLQGLARPEDPRRLHNDVDVQLPPRQSGGVFDVEHFDFVFSNSHHAVFHFDLL